jgi:predicted transcriptional regulator
MSKAVVISIRPKWCEKICGGEKTIEVRKTRPKLETPFKCYVYRTKGTVPHIINGKWVQMEVGGTIIAEFICDRIYKIDKDSTDFLFKGGGLSVYKQAAEEKCGLRVAMTDDELHGYLGHCQGYGWHISDLRIYDAPRELIEFERPCGCNECDAKWATECNACHEEGKIKRAPQSWCYVEEVECDERHHETAVCGMAGRIAAGHRGA